MKRITKNLIVKSSVLTRYRVPVSFIRHIDIEPIAACNLKCSFCQVPGWHRAHQTQPMDIDLFIKIIIQFPNLRSIKLQGMGEPLLNPNLIEMIRIASDRNIRTSVITNGLLLNSELARKMLAGGLTRLCFSFDGATKRTYENARINSNYHKVINNIEVICKIKRQMKAKTDIRMECLASNKNIIVEIPSLIKLASKLGIDKVNLKKRLKIWKEIENKGGYYFESAYLDSDNDYMRVRDQAIIIAEELGVEFGMCGDPEYSSSDPCFWPWHSMYVSTEGKVVPCCAIGIPETWCMGDLRKEELRDIWNNKAYRDMRRRMSLNQTPDLCKACYRKSSYF